MKSKKFLKPEAKGKTFVVELQFNVKGFLRGDLLLCRTIDKGLPGMVVALERDDCAIWPMQFDEAGPELGAGARLIGQVLSTERMHHEERPVNSANCYEPKGKTVRQLDSSPDTTLCQQTATAQRQRILEYLRYSPLTMLQAREHLDIMHPAARCMELREAGHNIKTEWTTEYSASGSRHRTARYSLEVQGDEGER